jgi:hypothetical protein
MLLPSQVPLQVLDQVGDQLGWTEQLFSHLHHGFHGLATQWRRLRKHDDKILKQVGAFLQVEMQQLFLCGEYLVSEGSQELVVLLRER